MLPTFNIVVVNNPNHRIILLQIFKSWTMKLVSLILIVFFCASSASTQEQITNYKQLASNYPKNLKDHLSFHDDEGNKYMVVDQRGNTSVYKWQNDSFELYLDIPIEKSIDLSEEFLYRYQNAEVLIEDNNMIRIYGSYIDVTDINTGNRLLSKSSSDYGVFNIDNSQAVDSILYFNASSGEANNLGGTTNSRKLFGINIYNQKLKQLPNLSYINDENLTSHDFYYSDSLANNIMKYNFLTDEVTMHYKSTSGIKYQKHSRSDSSMFIVEKDNSLIKVFKDGNVKNFDVKLVSENVKHLYINGNRLLVLLSTSNTAVDSLVVHNLVEKRIELEIEIGGLEERYSSGSYFVNNELNDTTFTILGYRDYNYKNGLHFVIDHKTEEFRYFDFVHSVDQESAVRFDNDIYFTFTNFHYEPFNDVGLIKCDFNKPEVEELFVELDHKELHLYSFLLAFPIDDSLFIATNSLVNSGTIWSVGYDSNLAPSFYFDLRDNLGFANLQDKVTSNGEIFFKSTGGVFSIKDTVVKYVDIEEYVSALSSVKEVRFGQHENYIAFFYVEGEQLSVCTINTNTHDIECEIMNVSIRPNYIERPQAYKHLLFFQMSDFLYVYNMKDKNLHKISDELPYLSSLSAFSETRLLTTIGYNEEQQLFVLDYEALSVLPLNINFSKTVQLYPARNDNFYVVEHNNSTQSSRIILIKADNSFEEIYNGPGKVSVEDIFNVERYPNDLNRQFFTITNNNDEVLIVSNNLAETHFFTLNNSEVILSSKSHLLLRSEEDASYQYFLSNGIEEPKFLFEHDVSSALHGTYINEKEILLYTLKSDSIPEYYNYNIENETLRHFSIAKKLSNKNTSLFRVDSDRFIIQLRINKTILPWLLDLELEEFIELPNLYDQVVSNYIDDVTYIDDKMYFTATIKNGSRQWYVFDSSLNTATELIDVSKVKELKVSPSPSSSLIEVSENLNHVNIYTINGMPIKYLQSIGKSEFIDVSQFDSGQYIIQGVTAKGDKVIGRFIKIN